MELLRLHVKVGTPSSLEDKECIPLIDIDSVRGTTTAHSKRALPQFEIDPGFSLP